LAWARRCPLSLHDALPILCLTDAFVLDPLVIILGDAQVAKRFTFDTFDVVRAEQIHVLVFLRELEGDIWNDDSQRKSLDANLLIGVFTLSIKEAHNVRVVSIEVNSSRCMAMTQLVRIREDVLENFHDRDNTRRGGPNILNRSTDFTKVGDVNTDTTTSFG